MLHDRGTSFIWSQYVLFFWEETNWAVGLLWLETASFSEQPVLCLKQAVSCLQGKQVKASGDLMQSQASKVTATNFLGPRQACRVCQKPKNNSADGNNDIGPPVSSPKTPYTKKTYCTPSIENNEHTPRYLFLEGLFWEIFFSVLAIRWCL